MDSHACLTPHIQLPNATELTRSGGHGIYYHFDYVGGLRDYKWLSTINLARVRDQLHLALEAQADRLWIVNVGDLKPLEVCLSLLLASIALG